jgi:pyruvate dehydrogenase E2 component (dihydrolipoamide acetyltransferase)
MTTKVVMEALSPTMEEGRLVEWKKQEGEAVAIGDVLAEVETDKAVMELVARTGGTMLKHIVEAGATVPVSEPVAVIGQPGEDVSGAAGRVPSGQLGSGAESQPAAKKEEQSSQPTPGQDRPVSMPTATPARAAEADRDKSGPGAVQAGNGADAATRQEPGSSRGAGRIKASPLARRMAVERGLDLTAVAGTGPEGRVVARDLEGATVAPRVGAATSAPSQPAPRPRGSAAPPYSDVPLTQIRKTIAKRLVQSIGPVPTFYLTTEIDMERVWEAREALLAGQQSKISFNDIIIKAVALALRQHPACNGWWQEDHIRYWNEVHVGMAVAIEDGLITPVIRHADEKPLRQIAAEARDLADRARERRLKPEEYTGATFSISNLGMLDIDEFTAVINPPEAGILAVGRIAEKPVAHEGAIVLRRRMRVTMSCDHRVIDGATGAEFLKTLKLMLENPLALVW